jgi:hypothetical protein
MVFILSLSLAFETARKKYAFAICRMYVAWNSDVIRYYVKCDSVFKLIIYKWFYLSNKYLCSSSYYNCSDSHMVRI